ncbi:MAG: PAS domain-containing protein, partial [Mariprofundaceae bacterium]|nr:PAS domain-containing protein [Mariprofundaceae bacterium]
MPDLNNLATLEERILILESENALLTQRTEDTLMLGLVSEAIEQVEDVTQGLNAALERISMLKDLPVVAYCSANENKATILQSYVSFSHTDINGFSFSIPEMVGDSVYISSDHPHLSHLHIPDIDFTPKQALFIPTTSSNKPTHVFLFLSSEQGHRLEQVSLVLERIVHIIAMVIENRNLLKSYKELNEELDYRVELRSRALQESEDKYHILIESSDTAIMLLSDDKFVDCNPATLRMFGCDSKEEFLSLSPVAVSPEFQSNGIDSATLARQYIDSAMETGTSRFDWIHKRMNGETFFAEVHATRVLIHGKMMV